MTDDQIEEIAERAAELAVEKMTKSVYQSIGKGVVEKFLWTVGVLSVALYVWASNNGWLKS